MGSRVKCYGSTRATITHEHAHAYPHNHIHPNTRTHKPTPATLTGLRGFDWAPKGPDNVLAYWAPERGQQPARVVMVELPSKREART